MGNSGERRSISGIRGTEDTLTLEKANSYTRAFATFLRQVNKGNRIVVGTDTRPSSPAYRDCVIEGIRDAKFRG